MKDGFFKYLFTAIFLMTISGTTIAAGGGGGDANNPYFELPAPFVVNLNNKSGITFLQVNAQFKVNKLENIFLYDIDDLKEVVNENSEQRMQEAVAAERIIEEEVLKFGNWLKTLDVVPTIVLLKDKIEAIREAEIRKSLSGLGDLTPEQVNSIQTLTSSMAEKIINDPIIALKKIAGRSSKDSYLDIILQD